MRIPVIILCFLTAVATHCLHAQSADDPLRGYFARIRAGVRTPAPELDAASLSAVIKPYLTDTLETVRIKSRELLFAAALASADAALQSKAIEQLLSTTDKNDVAITGIIIPMMKSFGKASFTDSAKNHVQRLVKDEGPYFSEWMKIGGFLEIEDLRSYIRPYSQPGNQPSTRWSALLSLARMGDQQAAAEILSRVKKLGVNDEVVYKIFPDLVFTRDRSVINYLIDVLHHDANECLSADVERETAIPCGYRIMEQLAPVIQGFPLRLDESGDLDVEDYDYASALHTVRQWFMAHKSYSIQKERY